MTDILEVILNAIFVGIGSGTGVWLANQTLVRQLEKIKKRLNGDSDQKP